MNQKEYEARVQELEAEGMTRSDAQGVADAEEMEAERKSEDDPMENRFETLEEAEVRAANLEQETGDKHIAYRTTYVFSPFVAERMPQIGDAVSKGFNGDYYPCGEIVRISPTYNRITTSDGAVFHRVSPMCWKQGGKSGAFSMVQGTHDRRNPEF